MIMKIIDSTVKLIDMTVKFFDKVFIKFQNTLKIQTQFLEVKSVKMISMIAVEVLVNVVGNVMVMLC